ncbi:hypothetical protein Save01_04248 [Streptomyces avermitilis]
MRPSFNRKHPFADLKADPLNRLIDKAGELESNLGSLYSYGNSIGHMDHFAIAFDRTAARLLE